MYSRYESIYELLSECFESMKMRLEGAYTGKLHMLLKQYSSLAVNSMAIFVCTAFGRIHFRVNACEKTVKADLTSVGLTAMLLYVQVLARREWLQDISIILSLFYAENIGICVGI